MAIRGLTAWVDKLGKREMPALGAVITELNALTGDDDTEVNQLAEVILKDANLTSQILRVANSVQYNPSNYKLNTVSRAIVLIGFNGVRAICVSVMVIETLLGKNPKDRLLEQMALAFHSAVQARQLVSHISDEEKEEVFIAALLYHLGEMAFWATGGAAVDEVDRRLDVGGANANEISKEVLGCTFKAITKSLASSWNLGETLENALFPKANPSLKVQAVCLGEELSQASLKGWDCAEMEEVLYKVSRFTGMTFADARHVVEQTADDAASVALTYGAPQICHLIPNRQRQEKQSAAAVVIEPLEPDHQLQLNVLRDLSNALMEKLDVNTIFQMVLEGLHRGIGLERVALAFVQKNTVAAKFILGEGSDEWRKDFQFPLKANENNIFSYTINKKEPLWLTQDMLDVNSKLYDAHIAKIIGVRPAFTASIYLGSRCIALFYADRWKHGGPLSEEQFRSFQHFMLQTQMMLKMIAESRK